MEFIIIGIVSALNLILIVHKFKKGRVEDAVFDSILFVVIASLFAGSYGGMVVAMISSLIISIYLYTSPPTFFRAFSRREDVQKAVGEFKDLAKPNKPRNKDEYEEIHFD